MIFESFGDDTEWNYFRLETGNLEPMNPEKVYENQELLAEINPGIYTDYECLEYDDFNGESLTSSARGITRVIQGDFVIFQKTSLYNKNPRTYDGRHNKLTADQFRDHISLVIEHLNKNKPVGRDISRTKIKYIILAKEVDWQEYNFLDDQDDIELASLIGNFFVLIKLQGDFR